MIPLDEFLAPPPPQWSQLEAIDLCVLIESFAPHYGCHVALTGGLLYRVGNRKDCDIVLYRIRQATKIDIEGLLEALRDVGFVRTSDHGFVIKCKYHGRVVDLLLPESNGGEYVKH